MIKIPEQIRVVAVEGTHVFAIEMWYHGAFPTVAQVREALRLGENAKVRILSH